jgi:uncharacterized protein YndB with AHSA1/START domain
MTPPVVPPIRKQVWVPLPVEQAFTTFTDQIGQWWPLATHSVGGKTSSVSFVDGQIIEVTVAGQRCVWGTVRRWQPPHGLAFTWHPGADPEPCTDVAVDFVVDGDGCQVTLTHSGWERIDAGADDLASYVEGWDLVLGGYQERAKHQAHTTA